MKHTAEPWYLGCNGGERIQIVVCESNIRPDEPTGLVAEVNKRIQFTPGSDPMNSPTADANAQRIVQCVNALAGIPDPAAALKAARGALEWTLEQAEDWRGSLTGSDLLEEYDEKLTIARAALAAIKGEQP